MYGFSPVKNRQVITVENLVSTFFQVAACYFVLAA